MKSSYEERYNTPNIKIQYGEIEKYMIEIAHPVIPESVPCV